MGPNRRSRSTARPPAAVTGEAPLASRTTLGLGGPARWLAEAGSVAEVVELLRWGSHQGIAVAVVSGGSNIVISDQGFDGLVVVPRWSGVRLGRDERGVRLTVGAGAVWDDVVAGAVAEGLAGIECLSGIPGSAGATPIQNVGAYGQEVAEVVESVRAVDRRSLETVELPARDCDFGYRTSLFRRQPGRFVVAEVVLRLEPGGPPSLRYAELERRVRERHQAPTLAEVRREVLALRRSKSMVLDDPADPNHRSVGSFFVNPVLPRERLAEVVRRALAAGAVKNAGDVPSFDAGWGRLKIPAGWLIEASGYPRGTRRGPVGLSTRHALALVHHGGGRTADLVAFAAEIRSAVRARFGISLEPEPTFLGFPPGDPLG